MVIKVYLKWISLVCICLFFILNSNAKDTKIVVGSERFADYQSLVKDKNIALLVNHTSLVGDTHLVDFLLANQINIGAIFAPEHGFRGVSAAGEMVDDSKEDKLNIPIYSMYGKNKKPKKDQLKNIDLLVFDIQDVGVRFYTYISSMHYFMEACAKYQIPMLVFDRPNPNGHYIDGPVLEEKYKSFVGMHPIPVVHGLTVGELALMINGEGWLEQNKQCDLTVIKVKNYDHNRTYSLPIKPSPNLPNDLSIALYPSLGFFEGTSVSVGRGTQLPFQMLAYPDEKFGEFIASPKAIDGSWKNLNYAKQNLYGEKLNKAKVGEISLSYLIKWQKKFESIDKIMIARPDFFDKLAGTDKLRIQIETGKTEQEIKGSWKECLKNYQQIRKKYLLYKDSHLIN